MRFFLILAVLITIVTVWFLSWLDYPVLHINFGGWLVELHSSILLPAFLVSFLILYILFGLLFSIKRLPEEYNRLRSLRKLKRKNTCLEEGMLSLIEGDWHNAGRFLEEGSRLSDAATIYQLGLAQVADHEGRLTDRQTHIALARHDNKKAFLGAALTQARLLHARSENNAAIDCLLEVRGEYSKSQELNNFLLELLQSEKRWVDVLAQLSYCRLPEERRQDVQQRAYKHLLRQAAAMGDIDTLHSFWDQMPRGFKRTWEMIQVYVRACLQCGDIEHCESLLWKQMKNREAVDIDMAMLYSMLPSEGLAKRIRYVERLLAKREQDAGLLFVTGVMYLRLNQRQRGIERLQNCARLTSWPEVYQVLARLSELDGDFSSATRYYKRVGGLSSDSDDLLVLLSVTPSSATTAESLVPAEQNKSPT